MRIEHEGSKPLIMLYSKLDKDRYFLYIAALTGLINDDASILMVSGAISKELLPDAVEEAKKKGASVIETRYPLTPQEAIEVIAAYISSRFPEYVPKYEVRIRRLCEEDLEMLSEN